MVRVPAMTQIFLSKIIIFIYFCITIITITITIIIMIPLNEYPLYAHGGGGLKQWVGRKNTTFKTVVESI